MSKIRDITNNIVLAIYLSNIFLLAALITSFARFYLHQQFDFVDILFLVLASAQRFVMGVWANRQRQRISVGKLFTQEFRKNNSLRGGDWRFHYLISEGINEGCYALFPTAGMGDGSANIYKQILSEREEIIASGYKVIATDPKGDPENY